MIDAYFGEADQEITSPDKVTALFLNYKPNIFDLEIHKRKITTNKYTKRCRTITVNKYTKICLTSLLTKAMQMEVPGKNQFMSIHFAKNTVIVKVGKY